MEQYRLTQHQLENLVRRRDFRFTCDGKGRVIDVHNPLEIRNPSLILDILPGRRLSEFFNLGKYQDLNKIPGGFKLFPALKKSIIHENVENFFTSLPLIVVKVFRLKPDRFLCLFMVSDIMPNFFPEKTNSLILVDRQDRLVGFNNSFYSLFSDIFQSPLKLLDQPAKRFFSPTPQLFQKMYLTPFTKDDKKGFKAVFQADFSKPKFEKPEVLSGVLKWSAQLKALTWNSTGESLSFLVLPGLLDLHKTALMVNIRVKVLKGHDPVFLLGPKAEKGKLPDDFGYLAGRHGYYSKAFIKKGGHLLNQADRYPDKKGYHTLTMVKSGGSFHLFHNGNQLVRYYDHEPVFEDAAQVSFGLRSGSGCAIKSIEVLTKPIGKEDRPENLLVKLNRPEAGYFILNRFYNTGLTSIYHDVAGYLLQDVSTLQYRAEHFEHEYRKQLVEEQKLRAIIDSFQHGRDAFIGTSPRITALKDRAKVIADSKATTLIEGDTGTGKEVLARFIHANSPNRDGSFIKVDCSTLPRELMESELFGHEAGAFTGAVKQKIGIMEQARKGTLFLDEIANLTPEAQTKLLQFLEDFTITRVGGTRPIKLDLRVIAATNVPLKSLKEKKAFREDLYFRLYVTPLLIPPLSERIEDIPELCSHFLHQFNATAGKDIRKISASAFRKMMAYHWPGNVRELRNVMQQAVLFCEGDEITGDLIHLQAGAGKKRTDPGIVRQDRQPGSYHKISKMGAKEFEALLKKYRGNITRLARDLDLSRRAIYDYLEKNDIDLSKFRPAK
jgi:DNA-binding NtrC family response regulator